MEFKPLKKMNVRIGSTADGRDSLYSIGRWISKIGIVK